MKNIPERARYVLISAVLSLILLGYACGRALELRNGAGVPWWEVAVAFALTAAVVPVILHCVGEALDPRLRHRPGRHRLREEPDWTGWEDVGATEDRTPMSAGRIFVGPLSDFASVPPTLWMDQRTSLDGTRPNPLMDPVLTEAATAIQNDRGKLPPELISDNEDAIRYATHYAWRGTPDPNMEVRTGRHHLAGTDDTNPHLFTNTDADLYGGYDRG